MKSWLVGLTMAVSGLGLSIAPLGDAEAKRLGGGKSSGMQRQAPAKPADTAPPAQPNNAATNGAPVAGAAAPVAGAAAAAGKRSWLGPVAGIAAGLGIAALMSHLGMGEGMGNFLTLLLMAGAAFFVIRWLLRRFGPARQAGGLRYAGAAAGAGGFDPMLSAQRPEPVQALQRTATEPLGAVSPAASPAAAATLPAGFDPADFERIAKMIFIRMQAANDAGAVDDLRKFTTPELFASLRLDLQDRGPAAQQTDVLKLDAHIIDTAQEDGQWIVSVRFTGLIREQQDAGAEPFDEIWHLVKPVDGSREWSIAGLQPQVA
jgi:predicted lipid-binding transport protein (Tim44 family)